MRLIHNVSAFWRSILAIAFIGLALTGLASAAPPLSQDRFTGDYAQGYSYDGNNWLYLNVQRNGDGHSGTTSLYFNFWGASNYCYGYGTIPNDAFTTSGNGKTYALTVTPSAVAGFINVGTCTGQIAVSWDKSNSPYSSRWTGTQQTTTDSLRYIYAGQGTFAYANMTGTAFGYPVSNNFYWWYGYVGSNQNVQITLEKNSP